MLTSILSKIDVKVMMLKTFSLVACSFDVFPNCSLAGNTMKMCFRCPNGGVQKLTMKTRFRYTSYTLIWATKTHFRCTFSYLYNGNVFLLCYFLSTPITQWKNNYVVELHNYATKSCFRCYVFSNSFTKWKHASIVHFHNSCTLAQWKHIFIL